MTTLAHPVAPSRHAPGIVSTRHTLLPKPPAGMSPEPLLRRRARRQGALLLAFSCLITLGGIAALLSWIF